jgi:hypothetical protein
MSLTIRLDGTADEEAAESEFSAMHRRCFHEMVAVFGTTITIAGIEKDCIAGPVELSFSREVVGKFAEDKIRAITMLADDFDEFDIVLDQTTCLIDGLTMTITVVDRDPQDPCVRFSTAAKV